MNKSELRFAPEIYAMRDFLGPHNEWISSVLGCTPAEIVTLELPLDIGQLAIDALIPDYSWGSHDKALAERMKSEVLRSEIPPGACPRVELVDGRKRGTPLGSPAFAWRGTWKECPFAVWLKNMPGPFVIVNVPYIAFESGPVSSSQSWFLVKRSSASALLTRLARLIDDCGHGMKMFRQHSVEIPSTGYDWNELVLDSSTNDLVRRDFDLFFQREDWFRRHRLPFRRGYLLYGPSGNGKTSVIRMMALHPAVTPMSIDFYHDALDNDSLNIFFRSAAHNAPSLVIFEDLDRVFSPVAKPDGRIKISFQQFLNCLDGIGTQNGIIVVATANNPASLGPAILRPGRFDRIVAFPAPSAPLRAEYLSRLATGADASTLATAVAESAGFSFAQLRESYILAGQWAFERSEEVSPADLVASIQVIRGTARQAAQFSSQSAGFRTGELLRDDPISPSNASSK